jgi:alkylated DNA repair dioxygenase AlkB
MPFTLTGGCDTNACSTRVGGMVVLQSDLFSLPPAGSDGFAVAADASFERIELDEQCWVDVARGWLRGSDGICEDLAAEVGWHHRRVRMYDRVVDEPRLTRWYPGGAALPHPALDLFRDAMAERYRVPFGPLGLNYYRDGRDSVALHRDRELRHLGNTIVAIVTFGARRPFSLHPLGGGRSLDIRPSSGDLLVMGGACQLHWEHGVPKVAAAGPRISASIRWAARPDPGDPRSRHTRRGSWAAWSPPAPSHPSG